MIGNRRPIKVDWSNTLQDEWTCSFSQSVPRAFRKASFRRGKFQSKNSSILSEAQAGDFECTTGDNNRANVLLVALKY